MFYERGKDGKEKHKLGCLGTKETDDINYAKG